MSHTVIAHTLTTMTNALDHHLITYSLPTPHLITLTAGGRPTDYARVEIHSNHLPITAATLLHWTHTLIQPQPRLLGETHDYTARIQIHGRLRDHTEIQVHAYPEHHLEQFRDHALTPEQTLLWLHEQASTVRDAATA
ncbi:hypothetical protein [Actinokineospora diospyrosa]|uniref:Polyketide cyclase/dehydrase/lipid transport protein n=1 Tax=Actinokineospora diospyrosa TaxID=103728 RepID=A0ABT1IE09_9PSEU|nr:hypothetical protein [Actinokineospora diospyrosa]MCP2270860.1 hypothetical protein [Actinokineospora diospyrosa]